MSINYEAIQPKPIAVNYEAIQSKAIPVNYEAIEYKGTPVDYEAIHQIDAAENEQGHESQKNRFQEVLKEKMGTAPRMNERGEERISMGFNSKAWFDLSSISVPYFFG